MAQEPSGFIACELGTLNPIIVDINVILSGFSEIRAFQIGSGKSTARKVRIAKLTMIEIGVSEVCIMYLALSQAYFSQMQAKEAGIVEYALLKADGGGESQVRPVRFRPVNAHQFALLERDIIKSAIFELSQAEIALLEVAIYKPALIEGCPAEVTASEGAVVELCILKFLSGQVHPIKGLGEELFSVVIELSHGEFLIKVLFVG